MRSQTLSSVAAAATPANGGRRNRGNGRGKDHVARNVAHRSVHISPSDAVPPAIAVNVTEKSFLQQVRTLARLLGWLTYHPLRSEGSEPGYPDLTLAHPVHGVIWAELKTEKGQLTAAQQEWQLVLGQKTSEVYVWRPSDWPEIERVLKG